MFRRSLPKSAIFFMALLATPVAGRSQDIHCTSRECHGTDAMGNAVLLRIDSERLDPTQRYTVQMGDDTLYIERKRSPVVSADWGGGPVLMQRPTTTITGNMNGQPVDLVSESSGLVTGNAFGKNLTCGVDGWSAFNPSPCF